MRLTVVMFGNDGRAARSLRMSASTLLACVALGAGGFSVVLWLGWKLGELTARL